ncbi:metallophosphoesterase, partial [Gemmatimonadota bacterium]
MFGTILNTAVALMHAYVFWRAASVPWIARRVPRKIIIVAAALLWLLFYLGREFGRGGAGPLATILELLIMDWMATIFLTTVVLLTTDIVTGFGFFLPRLAPWLRGLALAAGMIISLVAIVQGMRPPVIRNYEVSLAGLPTELDGTVVVAVSDTHLGSLIGKRWAEKLIERVNDQQPDIVLLVGDIFDGHGLDGEGVIPVLARLRAPMGVWAVLGNHDSFRRGTADYYIDAGINLLRNTSVEIRPGLVLAGVDNLRDGGYSGGNENPVAKALADKPPGATIFLSHKPLQTALAAQAGVGLMLSGHTHGGQVWPFGYLVKKRYPLFGGRYQVDGMTMIVSRGAGTWGPRMRLWRPGEIIRVTLSGTKPEI